MGILDTLRPVAPDVPAAGWVDAQGVHWDTPADALCHALGFCDCGAQDAALALVRDALRLVAWRGPADEGAHREWHWAVRHPHLERLFGAGRSDLMTFVWYMLDNIGLIEHGSRVPGWLTPLGQDILADLERVCDPDECLVPAAPPEWNHEEAPDA